mmetsp:Transcript_57812/g.161349  ORF Transcript_57812/g.161349 Transcript_57812/m.161349 type:complete len:258 (-) Transcript_57812:1145-1918(-)
MRVPTNAAAWALDTAAVSPLPAEPELLLLMAALSSLRLLKPRSEEELANASVSSSSPAAVASARDNVGVGLPALILPLLGALTDMLLVKLTLSSPSMALAVAPPIPTTLLVVSSAMSAAAAKSLLPRDCRNPLGSCCCGRGCDGGRGSACGSDDFSKCFECSCCSKLAADMFGALPSVGRAWRRRSAIRAINSDAIPGSPQLERPVASQCQNSTPVAGSLCGPFHTFRARLELSRLVSCFVARIATTWPIDDGSCLH